MTSPPAFREDAKRLKLRSIVSTLPETMPRPRSRAVAAARARRQATTSSPGANADRAAVDRLTRTFRALGDPARGRIVLALSRDELCVSDLAEIAGLSLSATSHQLRILRDLELVRVRRKGKNHLYALN